ncbi:adenylate/guanylate cyclase domain-containing protein [Mariprofundus erugo]|nr:adenylate/guanylate cyclase domain-containing protein [Mariprofundus erugo]
MNKFDMGMTEIEDGGQEQPAAVRLPWRIPIRWRWAMLVGFAVAIAVVVLFFIILDIERDAWLQSQASQAALQVDRLSDELKLPLLSGSSVETGLVVQKFLEKVPAVSGALIRHVSGRVDQYGEPGAVDGVLKSLIDTSQVQRLPGRALWYTRSVSYAGTPLAVVAVRFSSQEWDVIAGKLVIKISIAAVVVVLLSTVLVFWVASRMSRPIELLAGAARKVADGDYTVRLPVSGNDEISDAVSQFNVMTRELAHKEELRAVFGRYLNPKLVSDVFDGGDAVVESHRQEISVLFADMVHFTSFSESHETEEVVRVLNKHFEVFHRVVAYFGGHVDKYIGDALMGVFNHPVNDAAHVRHAAMAALAIDMACMRLGVRQKSGEPIAFRLGLNCGQAIVGNIGAAQRLEYTVIGDAVNVASRMGGLGSGRQLLMPRETFERLGAGFTFTAVGECEIKGISRRIEAGVVTAESDAVLKMIAFAVDLAFGCDLSEDRRHSIG